MYSTRQKKLAQILKLLAFKKELYQQLIALLAHVSERSIIRQLQVLRSAGLIEIARKEPSSRHGMPKQIWRITFSGLMSLLSLSEINMKEIDQIAEGHADEWILFQEWKNLTQDSEVKKAIIIGILKFASQNSAILKPQESTMYANYLESLGEAGKPFQQVEAGILKRNATLSALMLEPIFTSGAVPPWTYEPKNKDNRLVRLWKTAYGNPSIKSFIKEEFKREIERHRQIRKFQDWLRT